MNSMDALDVIFASRTPEKVRRAAAALPDSPGSIVSPGAGAENDEAAVVPQSPPPEAKTSSARRLLHMSSPVARRQPLSNSSGHRVTGPEGGESIESPGGAGRRFFSARSASPHVAEAASATPASRVAVSMYLAQETKRMRRSVRAVGSVPRRSRELSVGVTGSAHTSDLLEKVTGPLGSAPVSSPLRSANGAERTPLHASGSPYSSVCSPTRKDGAIVSTRSALQEANGAALASAQSPLQEASGSMRSPQKTEGSAHSPLTSNCSARTSSQKASCSAHRVTYSSQNGSDSKQLDVSVTDAGDVSTNRPTSPASPVTSSVADRSSLDPAASGCRGVSVMIPRLEMTGEGTCRGDSDEDSRASGGVGGLPIELKGGSHRCATSGNLVAGDAAKERLKDAASKENEDSCELTTTPPPSFLQAPARWSANKRSASREAGNKLTSYFQRLGGCDNLSDEETDTWQPAAKRSRLSGCQAALRERNREESGSADASIVSPLMQLDSSDIKKKTADYEGNNTGNDQLMLDVDQKEFGLKQCSGCGMMYAQHEPADELMHLTFHSKFFDATKYPAWKQEEVVSEFMDGKIVVIDSRSPTYMQKKVEEVLSAVDTDLGFVDNKGGATEARKTYLFVIGRKIVGACVGEPIQHAFRVIPDSTDTDIVKQRAWLCNENSVAASVGINRVWVHHGWRKQYIATRLVDCLRKNFLHCWTISKSDIAFTSPTPDGRLFASAYCSRPDYLVYVKNLSAD